jgi:hypothetical protein
MESARQSCTSSVGLWPCPRSFEKANDLSALMLLLSLMGDTVGLQKLAPNAGGLNIIHCKLAILLM